MRDEGERRTKEDGRRLEVLERELGAGGGAWSSRKAGSKAGRAGAASAAMASIKSFLFTLLPLEWFALNIHRLISQSLEVAYS